MMEFLQQAIVMLATLAVLIAFHEWGHFWVARRCGVKVLRFSIGFGPQIFTKIDKQGTEFSLSLLPLGGYVKMLDEREGDVALQERDQAFNNKSVYQRIAIVAAGPIANFILAIVVYWFVFLQGTSVLAPIVQHVEVGSIAELASLEQGLEIVAVDGNKTDSAQKVALQLLHRIGDSGQIIVKAKPIGSSSTEDYRLNVDRWLADAGDDIQPLSALGFSFYNPAIAAIVAEVLVDSAAQKAGLQAGDELLLMDDVAISDWMSWVDYVQSRANVSIQLQYNRAGITRQTVITPQAHEQSGHTIGMVGIRVQVPDIPAEFIRHKEYNIFTAWLPALSKTWQTSLFSLMSLKKMLLGDISYKQLSGPISIAKVATESARSGIYSYLSLLALLSVSLGVLNLLPIPVLDGGHIFFYLIEWIKGSPVPEKVQMLSFQVGMVIVMSVMVLAVVNDIGRL